MVWKKLEEVSDSSTYYVHTFVVDDVWWPAEVQSVKKFCGSKFVEKKNFFFFLWSLGGKQIPKSPGDARHKHSWETTEWLWIKESGRECSFGGELLVVLTATVQVLLELFLFNLCVWFHGPYHLIANKFHYSHNSMKIYQIKDQNFRQYLPLIIIFWWITGSWWNVLEWWYLHIHKPKDNIMVLHK